MNRINSKKLLHSKWTAVEPRNREKHFMVTEVDYDEEGKVVLCILEAVLSDREYSIDWTQLKSRDNWLQGWK